MNNQKVMVPDYYVNFKCIAGECEDTCCNGWRIYVDESTYNFYKEVKDNKLSDLFQNNVHVNEEHKNISDYGMIDVRENGDCVFLSGDRLCDIYSDLGQDHMCTTCREYPRNYNYADKKVEKSLSLSCPEACRQILFRDNPIEFFEGEEHIEEITIHGSIDTDSPKNDSEKFFWPIRIFTIQVLQVRDLTIEERMAVLGLFFYDINNAANQDIQNIIDEYMKNIEEGRYCGILKELKYSESKTKVQLLFMLRMCGTVLNKISSPGYFNDFKDIVNGLGLDGSKSYEELKSTYLNTKSSIYNLFIKENPNVYENYLVNYVYKTLFPKTDMSFFEIYLNLVMNFSVLKFNIIGLSAYHGTEMDRKKLVHLVSNFSRMTEHNKNTVKIFNDFIHKNGFYNIDDILLLIGD